MAYSGLRDSAALISEWVEDEDTVVYLKLFTILYADDTVIFAESMSELQAALHGMHHHCNIWKLGINIQKTTVLFMEVRQVKYQGTEFQAWSP